MKYKYKRCFAFQKHHKQYLTQWMPAKTRVKMIMCTISLHVANASQPFIPISGCLCLSLSPHSRCFYVTRPLEFEPKGDSTGPWARKPPKKSIDQMYDVIWSNWQTQKVLKQKPWINRGLSTVCFQNSPAESSDASPPSQSLPRSSLALSITPSLLPPSPTICPPPLSLLPPLSYSLSLSLCHPPRLNA